MANVVKLYYVDTGSTYKQWELLPNKLLVIDSVADYLATKTALTISNFQYIKNELEIGINVDLSQSYSQPKTTTSFKYVSIQNDGESVHYYFIKKIIWRSKSAVRLELVMDVLNTFKEGTDYVFKENTRIIREHKNRFNLYNRKLVFTINPDYLSVVGEISENASINFYGESGGYTYDICSGIFISYDTEEYILTIMIDNNADLEAVKEKLRENYNQFIVSVDDENYYAFRFTSYEIKPTFMRRIDYVSEGITPILNHSGETTIQDGNNTILQQNWYLLYRNQDEPDSTTLVNPVKCFLIPESVMKVNSGVINYARMDATFLQIGYTYYINIGTQYPSYDQDASITLDNGTTINPNTTANYSTIVGFKRNADNTMTIIAIRGTYGSHATTYLLGSWTCKYVVFSTLPLNLYVNSNSQLKGGDSEDFYDINTDVHSAIGGYIGLLALDNTNTYQTINSIEDIDKTDAKNIKLLKLPYCPYNFSISSGILQIADDVNWNYEKLTQADETSIYVLRLTNLNTKLEHDIYSNASPFSQLYLGELNPSKTDLRFPLDDENKPLESKLFHSDFYSPTIVYDSFSFKIDLEKCAYSWYQLNNKEYGTTYKFTMTKTINSKFMFTIKDYNSFMPESNFYKVIPIARNNEEVLYNVPYINYIRTGYQYDVKNKDISTISNAIGLGLSVASVGASLLLPSAPLKVAGVVASLVSVANSIKNTIVSEVNNSNAIKQKQEQYRNQASSVVGSDDVDLMSEYCGNRLKYFIYKPNDIMINLLNDLFFYAGYNSNRMGLPNHNTRVNFDYLECEASIEKIASIPDECLNEMINCFKTGVCYLHKTSRVSDKWDFSQKYENWEAELFV